MPRRPASQSPVPTRRVRLTGWGRIAPTRADLAAPASDAEAAALLRYLAEAPAGKSGKSNRKKMVRAK